ncbi:MAG: hypothetical protein WCP20_05120 [Desulfuromonadales bacterium]
MSYILDALKKVEHEKSRKTSVKGITSISGDLFQERIPRPSRGGAGKIIVVGVFVALLTFAVTWFLLKDEKKNSAVASRSTASPAVTAPAVPPSPPAPASAIVPIVEPPTRQIPVPPPPSATTSKLSIVSQPGVVVSDDVDHGVKAEKKLIKNPSAVPRLEQTAVQKVIAAPADIKVSGIAWQEERAARRVVINGFLLQEGTTVSGAKILEIHPERVRFTSPAGIFDVYMDAGSPSGVPK